METAWPSLGFNTQPRGGGCEDDFDDALEVLEFQHTAARRRLRSDMQSKTDENKFQHTAARRRLLLNHFYEETGKNVSTHSRAEAAAFNQAESPSYAISFNTQPRGGGCFLIYRLTVPINAFQHTAARRRLPNILFCFGMDFKVSTHSRAEAAAPKIAFIITRFNVSTHSRAEAAAFANVVKLYKYIVSTHSRAEAAAAVAGFLGFTESVSTHSRAEAAANGDAHH